MEYNKKIKIDSAAIVAAKIEALAACLNETRSIDSEAYNRILWAYQLLRRLTDAHGGVQKVQIEAEGMVRIMAIVPDLDLYRDGLAQFRQLLGVADTLHITWRDAESVCIEVGLTGLWKEGASWA